MMTKARSKSARRRLHKLASDHDLAPTPKRERNGQPSRRGQPRTHDIETLKARCIQMGKSITPDNLREMRAPWWGCNAGRVIGREVMEDKDRLDLWSAIMHMRRVVTAYDAAIGAPRRHAVCLRLLQPNAELSADAETPPIDMRDGETRQRHAVAALMTLEGWLGYVDKPAASEAKRVVLDDTFCADREGLLIALRCVSDGIKGAKMQYRGRH